MRLATAFALLLLPSLPAQNSGVVTVSPLEKARVKRGEEFVAKTSVHVKPGFHVNSNAPDDPYLIPLKLTWTGPLQAESVTFPNGEKIKSSFSEKPLVVFTGAFDIVTKFKVPANAPDGPNLATGKLRYQACNDKECLRPQTIDVNLSLEIR
jgi:thiol:disulfide interchange protein DsbD